jgi:hypothetical protein
MTEMSEGDKGRTEIWAETKTKEGNGRQDDHHHASVAGGGCE